MNIDQFKWGVICQQFPMALIEDHQGVNEGEARAALNEWKEEVLTKQNSIKSLASPLDPTNFSYLYSSRVNNLLRYLLNHSRGADWRSERDIELILKILKR